MKEIRQTLFLIGLGAALNMVWLFGIAGPAQMAINVESFLMEVDDGYDVDSDNEITEGILAHAANCEQAVVFLHVDWSGSSKLALRNMNRYVSMYLAQPDAPFVNFHVANLTEFDLYQSDLWKEYLEECQIQGKRRAGFHGSGELIFIKQGKVIDVNQLQFMEDRISEAVDWTNQLASQKILM